ncbi:MAG: SPOR domain-containing protein [Ignavibacteriaceae bacterium]|jgi:cell division protein FtsN|nr:SPOR domain-containing protein [Ignavibacteriaceae bacterium]
MRILIYFILVSVLVFSSCERKNKPLGKNNMPVAENITPKIEEKTVPDTANPIKEVEEKLVANNNKLPNPHHYFVIIGSFRNPDNAKKYQEQILKNGFNSEILKNEAGLYRVSVMATNETREAMKEIRRIRSVFPEYYDTWLLIQKK